MTLRPITVVQLVSIWSQYVDFRRPQVAPSTVARDYAKITKRLTNMKIDAPDIETGDQVRDYLLSRYSHETTRRTIQQLQASTRWAVFQGWLPANPFDGVTFYLPQYNMRHTFITEALKHLEVNDVSYLCRVSVEVLLKHYASRSRELSIPEF